MFKHVISAFGSGVITVRPAILSFARFWLVWVKIRAPVAYVQVISKNFLTHFQRVTFSLKFFS